MIDNKKFGVKICSLRKKNGYSQEKFAEILCVSPQAVSKWENGHALPEISLLPVLARLFDCTIDELLMSDYIPDEIIGLEDYEIIIAVKKIHVDLSNFKIIRSKPIKNDHCIMIYITVFTPKIELKLIQKIFAGENDSELFGFNLFHCKTNAVPMVYYINTERKILLTEDLTDNYIKGNSIMYIVTGIDKDCEDGLIYRDNLKQLIRSVAEFHSVYWGNFDVFGKIGLPWHCESKSKENMFAWIYNMMEKPLQTYIDNIKSGNVVKEGIGDNNITDKELGYFYMALDYIKSEYGKYIDTRFHTGKNLTVIHRELHPGVTYMAKSDDRTVKISELHGLHIGLCTDNLAMLIALHIDFADSLLEYYYQCLRKNDYSYETFVSDYKLSVAVSMFFPIRLINNGIGDFLMRDRALKAFINL